jgi:hypothetical protein
VVGERRVGELVERSPLEVQVADLDGQEQGRVRRRHPVEEKLVSVLVDFEDLIDIVRASGLRRPDLLDVAFAEGGPRVEEVFTLGGLRG